MSAGNTVSIRVPPGTKERLQAATGLPFSTVVRHIVMAMLAHYEAERKSREAQDIQQAAKADIEHFTQEALKAGESQA